MNQNACIAALRKILLFISPALLILTAAGCGDSSNGGNAGSKDVKLSYDIKTLWFAIPPQANATHYLIFENRDSISGFEPISSPLPASTRTASYGYSVAVHQHNWGATRYRVESCVDAACTPLKEFDTVGAAMKAVGYFKPKEVDKDDNFGESVVVSADGFTLAISVPGEDSDSRKINAGQKNNAASHAGAVYIFAHTPGGWVEQAYIKASNTDTHDNFGEAIALSADGATLAVGAPGQDGFSTGIGAAQNGTSTVGDSGSVYVFTRSGSSWQQQIYIKAFNAEAGDHYGSAVALSTDGNTLAVGSPREDSAVAADGATNPLDNSVENTGAVYVYSRAGTTWSEQGFLKARVADVGDKLGSVIALSADGNTLAAAALDEAGAIGGIGGDQTNDAAPHAGAVTVFVRAADTWTREAYIKASHPRAEASFGQALALSENGDTLAVGSDDSSNAVGVNGDASSTAAPGAGSASLFSRTAGTWSQQAYVKPQNTGTGDHFGRAVALSADGSTLAVGAPGEDTLGKGLNPVPDEGSPDSGAVYLFEHIDDLWSQQAFIKAPKTDAGDEFGAAVSLNDTGGTLAIGARHEDGGKAGINADLDDESRNDAGAVFLY